MTVWWRAESQGVLADFNLLVDKLNTDTDRVEVEQEAAELKSQNDTLNREVEALFIEKQEREATIAQLEQEIGQERNMADNLVAAMQPELREKYLELQNRNIQYQVRPSSRCWAVTEVGRANTHCCRIRATWSA